MLSQNVRTLVLAIAVCVAVLYGGWAGPAAASGYFPDTLVPCFSSLAYALPPDDILAQSPSQPPVPLFTQSLESLARWAIVPKWLPDRFDDAKYLEHGEGAYRARTAHLCKIYEKSGACVTLKRFVGHLTAIVEPLPITLLPEAHEALLGAAEHTDPCKGVSPYKDTSAPPAVASLFASIRDDLLSEAAHPISLDDWNRRIRLISMINGGLRCSYSTKEPFEDPVLATNGAVRLWLSVWTNGRLLVVTVGGNTMMAIRSELYKELQPATEIPTDGLQLPYVSKIVFKGEWSNGQGHLVPNRGEATHQKLYFDMGDGLRWMAEVPYPSETEHIQAGAWLCLARRDIATVASLRHAPKQTSKKGSPSEVLQRLATRRDACLDALTQLQQAPCPGALLSTRESLLSVLGVAKSIWDVAWREWESALTGPVGDTLDYETVMAAIDEKISSAGLPVSWDWGPAWEVVGAAEKTLGMRTDDR